VYPRPHTLGLADLPMSHMHEGFETNTLGPMRMSKAVLGLLIRSDRPRIAHISSGAGSLTKLAAPPHSYAYAVSKTALNMAMRTMARELKEQSIVVVCISPGWVRTDMGGQDAELSIDEAGAAIARTTLDLTMEQTGLWLDRFGQVTPFAW
jgi:NAD(P)-dependent dehydrogenase (short-subunit alcohol dehydrogenase family)